MSRVSRQRDSLAPSLFPFLAVLLCTMGALVLILMLVVSGAQASALHFAEQSTQQAEEVESQLELASQGFQKQLTEAQIELEKKRLALQHLENHIQELLTEMEQLQRTAELADADLRNDEAEKQSQAETISLLEQQLLEAGEKLKQKLDKPEGDKPIFAIIPYDGPNGTLRRPIYLECVEQGIRIQPEGVLLTTEDLEPPYGPGNPLDAALRTIRAHYVPANHAVTSTAYPLLVVRPTGIRSYAMARAAMSGWDDQFGYELVGDEVELTYPDGEPGLSVKIDQAIELARERQAALIVAMPQKYRALSERDRPLTGGGSGSGSEVGAGSYGGGGYASGSGSASGNDPSGYGAGARGGWANDDSSVAANSLQGDGDSSSQSPSGYGAMGYGGGSAQGTNSSELMAGNQGESFFGSEGGANDSNGASYDPYQDSSRRNAAGSSLPGTASDQGPASLGGLGSASGPGGAVGSGGENGAAQGVAGGQAANGNPSNNYAGGASGSANAGSAGGAGSSQMSGNQMAVPFNAPNQGGSSANVGGSSAQASGGTQTSGSGGASSSDGQSRSDMADPQDSPQLSVNQNLNEQRQETTTPVAGRRGRGWAWSQGPPTQTAVGRSIRLQCLADRWIVLPDSGPANDPAAITIPFDKPPQQRAEQLARVIAERVDSWGLALMGGYWKPSLVVDVAPDAEWRFEQLQQLLDGSGLEVQRSR